MHGGKVIETAQTIPALDQEPGPLVVLGAVSLGEEVEVVLGIGPGLGHRDVVKMALGLAQKLVPMTQPSIRTEFVAKQGRASRYLKVKKTVEYGLEMMEKDLNRLNRLKNAVNG